jgi:F0F1-type ATP synthase membrane subunit a
MSWLGWLGLAVIITGILAVTGIKPRGTRHVAHTHMMWVARLVLLAILIIVSYLAFRARSGG